LYNLKKVRPHDDASDGMDEFLMVKLAMRGGNLPCTASCSKYEGKVDNENKAVHSWIKVARNHTTFL